MITAEKLHNPPLSKEWIIKYFKKDYLKRSYNRFQWWRSYTPKRPPLKSSASFKDKIYNGDYDHSPLLFEAYLAEYKLNELWNECNQDYTQFSQPASIHKARRKRLLEDYTKDENSRLETIRINFMKEFKIDRKVYYKEAENSSKNLRNFYDYMSRKYKT